MSGQLWSINQLGGFMHSSNLSDKLRMGVLPTVKFRQFCDAKDAMSLGLNQGDKFNWNTYSRLVKGGGLVGETDQVPTTHFTIVTKQLTVSEYMNSVPYSGKLDDLSLHKVDDIIRRGLKIDFAETIDGAAHAQYNNTYITVTPVSGTSTTAVTVEEGGATITNNVALGKDHIKAISDVMKERNIPPYLNDDYYSLSWPTTIRGFKNDLEAISHYVETGFRHIMNGEVGRYESFRFCEQTHIKKGGAADSTTWNFRTADPWDSGLSDWCFFLGEDTVAEAIVIPEEIRGKIPTDFGRNKGIAWYYLGGFGLVHGSDAETAENARVIKWDSAA